MARPSHWAEAARIVYYFPSIGYNAGMNWPQFSRWLTPRYSLRMLFAVVTVVAIWLGWEMSIVRERNTWAHRIIDAGGSIDTQYPELAGGNQPIPKHLFVVREWLGDKGYAMIVLPNAFAKDIEKFKRIFPEACVGEYSAK